jgi:rSAM/selenodomain-associated transferase 2
VESVSVIVPVLNDAAPLERLLASLHRAVGRGVEIVVVDGGSADGSDAIAACAGVRLVRCRPGRGFQIAEGAAAARGVWLWMLHADSEPSRHALEHLLTRPDVPGWGRFSVRFDAGPMMALVATLMNARSRLTGICTGDQGIFVHRDLLRQVGGMPRQSLMEDIELCRRLKRLDRPDCRPEAIGTSARRWRSEGTLKTIVGMWRFRLRYWRGADPEQLAREYYRS